MRGFGLASACAAALAIAVPAHASFAVPPNEPGHYAPRDECGAVPDAGPFLDALRSAATKRDAAALAALAAPNILLDFGGGEGKDEFARRLADPENAPLWSELDELLALGCAAEDGRLTMPWFFAQDLGDSDPFDTSLVLGADVPLRSRPDRNSRVRTRLNWQLVFVREAGHPEAELVPVSVIDSKWTGYVEAVLLRSQIDYRLIAEKDERGWRITAFIAGD